MHYRIMEWARGSTFENDMNIDHYVPPREVEALRLELKVAYKKRLVFLVGPQGSGKSSALYYLYKSLLNERHNWDYGGSIGYKIDSYFQSLTPGFGDDHFDHLRDFEYLFFDLPDYPVRSLWRMHRDVDKLMRGWRRGEYNASWVISVQKELFEGHFAFGKGEEVKILRRTPEELREIYLKRLGDPRPFTDGGLLTLGRLSRGICRRFIKYAGACADAFYSLDVEAMDEDAVVRVITPDMVVGDADLELSSFLGEYEKLITGRVLVALRAGEMNQKRLAAEVGVSESSLSRVLGKLVEMGWVVRRRGERKEQLVRLT